MCPVNACCDSIGVYFQIPLAHLYPQCKPITRHRLVTLAVAHRWHCQFLWHVYINKDYEESSNPESNAIPFQNFNHISTPTLAARDMACFTITYLETHGSIRTLSQTPLAFATKSYTWIHRFCGRLKVASAFTGSSSKPVAANRSRSSFASFVVWNETNTLFNLPMPLVFCDVLPSIDIQVIIRACQKVNWWKSDDFDWHIF